MYTYKKIKVPMYKAIVHFCIVNHIPTKVKRLSKKYTLVLDGYDYEDSSGLFVYQDVEEFHYFIIINSAYIEHSNIAHEIQHCTDQFAEHMGEEVMKGYFNGHVTKEILKHLKDKGIKVSVE